MGSYEISYGIISNSDIKNLNFDPFIISLNILSLYYIFETIVIHVILYKKSDIHILGVLSHRPHSDKREINHDRPSIVSMSNIIERRHLRLIFLFGSRGLTLALVIHVMVCMIVNLILIFQGVLSFDIFFYKVRNALIYEGKNY